METLVSNLWWPTIKTKPSVKCSVSSSSFAIQHLGPHRFVSHPDLFSAKSRSDAIPDAQQLVDWVQNHRAIGPNETKSGSGDVEANDSFQRHF